MLSILKLKNRRTGTPTSSTTSRLPVLKQIDHLAACSFAYSRHFKFGDQKLKTLIEFQSAKWFCVNWTFLSLLIIWSSFHSSCSMGQVADECSFRQISKHRIHSVSRWTLANISAGSYTIGIDTDEEEPSFCVHLKLHRLNIKVLFGDTNDFEELAICALKR